MHGDCPAGGFRMPVIALKVRGEVEVIDVETFAVIATTVKETCLISKALGGVGEITPRRGTRGALIRV